MKIVRFLANASPYSAGEIAGFDRAVADAYIKSGVAEVYKEIEEPAQKMTDTPEDKTHKPKRVK